MVFQLADPDRPFLKVDIFLDHPIPFGDLWADRTAPRLGSVEVLVASIEHVLELKRLVQPPRAQDVSDIEALERVLRLQDEGTER